MIDFRHILTNPRPNTGVKALRQILRLGSIPYAVVSGLRNLAYDHGWKKIYQSPLPVISVGNLSVGGTGKSPMVAWLARWLRTRGVRVAILSRGYGQLDSGQNDEALELEIQLPDVPHLQYWDRIASAKLAEQELEMEMLILDDGFQHRRLGRDLEIVLLDATSLPAACRLLPAGLMREPLSSLMRADVVVLTRTDQITPETHTLWRTEVQKRSPNCSIVSTNHEPVSLLSYPDRHRDLAELRGKRVLAFCAIGNPESFFGSLPTLGAEILDRKTWPDHHAFTADDIAWLTAWPQTVPQADMLICTMKDWVKLQIASLGQLDLVALQVVIKICQGEELLEQRLSQILKRPAKPVQA